MLQPDRLNVSPIRSGTQPSTSRSLSILLVEDDEALAEVQQAHLQLCGHQVEVARDGEGALRAAGRTRFDLILCDVTLPGDTDGYAVAEAVRSDPALVGPFVVALTAHLLEDVQKSPRCISFDAVLTKPLRTDELGCLIERLGLEAPLSHSTKKPAVPED
jgi:CheY-like chemotaxis protein